MAQRVGYMLAAAAHQAIRAAPLAPIGFPFLANRSRCRAIQIDEATRGGAAGFWRKPGRIAQGQVDGLPDAYFADARLKMYDKQGNPTRSR